MNKRSILALLAALLCLGALLCGCGKSADGGETSGANIETEGGIELPDLPIE